jgi:hypothetical protein
MPGPSNEYANWTDTSHAHNDRPTMTKPIPRSGSMREDIERHVASFRERQRRFNEARETYSQQTFARLRAGFDRADVPSSDLRDRPAHGNGAPGA